VIDINKGKKNFSNIFRFSSRGALKPRSIFFKNLNIDFKIKDMVENKA